MALVGYQWSQQQYYVAAYGERVAIYQGVQADLPGVQLHHVYESQDLLLTELPSFRRSQVIEGMTANDLAHAQRIVDKLLTFAQTCARQASQPASQPVTTATVTTATVPTETLTPTPRSPERSPTPRRIDGPATAQLTTSAEPRTTEATEPVTPRECAGASPATGTGTPQ